MGWDVAREQRDECEDEGDEQEYRQVERAYLVKHGTQYRGGKERDDQTDKCAGANQNSGAHDNEAQDVRALRAERHPDTNLVCSLDNEERHHAEDANRGKNEGDPGEDGQEHDGEAAGRDGIGNHLVEGTDMRDGQGRINRLYRAAQRARQTGGVLSAADGEDHRRIRGLQEWNVEFRFYGLIEAAMMEVADNADDVGPDRAFAGGELHSFAEGFAVGPITLGKGAVNDDDWRSIQFVRAGEETAFD